MRQIKLLFCVAVLLSCLFLDVSCKNYFIGNKTDTSRIVTRQRLFYEAIPWKKRVRSFDYIGSDRLQIKAIWCYDYQNSDASVNITNGGIGFNHVELRIKTERSYRLDYAIEIYD